MTSNIVRCYPDRLDGLDRIKERHGSEVKVIDKIFGTHSEREIKRITPLVDKIESLRPDMMELSDFLKRLPWCGRRRGGF